MTTPFRLEDRLPLLAALAAALLLVSQVLAWASVEKAARAASRGEAEVLLESLSTVASSRDISEDELEEFLETRASAGLVFVRVRYPHRTWQAGESTLPELGDQQGLMSHGGRIRAIRRPPRVAGRRAKRPGPRFRRPRQGRPPPREGEGRPPPIPELEVEFEPRLGPTLRSDGQRGLWASGFAALLFLVLAGFLRRALRQREDARKDAEEGRRLAALGEMSGVVAHELRNPLASLKGHAQLLVRVLEQGTAEHQKAERVVTEAVRLEKLSRSLLEFVRSGELHLDEVDLVALLDSAVAEVGRERFLLDLPSGGAFIAGDGVRLREVFVNVLSNAVQASDEADQTRAISVSLSTGGGESHVRIRDYGRGIPEGDEDQVFVPFHTSKTQGVGLGLAVSRRIVELHGGRIVARNVAGGGAEFEVVLPKAKTEAN